MFLILLLVLRCGLSVSEIVSLKLTDARLDAEGKCFFTFTKYKNTRYVKVPDDVLPYLLKAGERPVESGMLFQNHLGKPLSARLLNTKYTKMLVGTNLEGKYTLQDLRNAAISYMLAGGADPEDVAAYVDIEARWMYRYNAVIPSLSFAPCDYSCIRIK